MSLLEIKDLHVSVEKKAILKGVSLALGAGEMHIVMGQNGSGKSTLAHAIAGNPHYTLTEGDMLYEGQSLLALPPNERAQRGIFISFQHPIDLPGLRVMTFLQSMLNACLKARGEAELNAADFLRLVREKAASLNITENMLRREVNVGFSGGERKRFEALQMLLLEPKLIVLDEIDSGLDIDALKNVVDVVLQLHQQGSAVLLITHYQNLLKRLNPNQVHIFQDGKVTRSGDKNLALEVERSGYQAVAS